MSISANDSDGNAFRIVDVHGYTVRASADGTRLELRTPAGEWRGLKQFEGQHRKGYLRVRLPNGKTVAAHTLVAMAWHGPRPTAAHKLVEHLDGSKRNNRKHNVRWATHRDNLNSAFRLRERERKYPPKLGEAAAYEIRTQRHRSEIAALAEEFGTGEQTIRDVFDGRTWRHVRTDQPRIPGTY